jgi:phosphinothricin acetyltransferase
VVEDNFYLGPAAAGRGLGRVLLGDLIDRCRTAGVKRIVSVIADKNADASIHLHESFGFVHIGTMGKVGFKYGRWLGTVLLELKLSKKR